MIIHSLNKSQIYQLHNKNEFCYYIRLTVKFYIMAATRISCIVSEWGVRGGEKGSGCNHALHNVYPYFLYLASDLHR